MSLSDIALYSGSYLPVLVLIQCCVIAAVGFTPMNMATALAAYKLTSDIVSLNNLSLFKNNLCNKLSSPFSTRTQKLKLKPVFCGSGYSTTAITIFQFNFLLIVDLDDS